MFLLTDKVGSKKIKYEVSQFFNIQSQPVTPAQEDLNDYMLQSALEIVHPSTVESIEQGIEQINTSKFDIVAI